MEKHKNFKKLGVTAIIAAVGMAAVFQLGSFVKDQVYNINADQYTQEETVKFGNVTDFKIETINRLVNKQVAEASEWDSLPKEAKNQIKQIKEYISSDEFRHLVQDEKFYRSAESAARFDLGWALNTNSFYIPGVGKPTNAFNSFMASIEEHYSGKIKNETPTGNDLVFNEDKTFSKNVDLAKVKNAYNDDLVLTNAVQLETSPYEFSKVKNKIEDIRKENLSKTSINSNKPS